MTLSNIKLYPAYQDVVSQRFFFYRKPNKIRVSVEDFSVRRDSSVGCINFCSLHLLNGTHSFYFCVVQLIKIKVNDPFRR